MTNSTREPRGRDLDNVDEIAELVRRFYREIAQEVRFHHYFDDVAAVDWQAHTRRLTDFWAGLLLGTSDADADTVIEKHRWLNDHTPFDSSLFERWLEILDDTIDGGWSGPLAEQAKKRGFGYAWAMAHRLSGINLHRSSEETT